MYKILIVEDEPAMQMGLKDNLEFDGYSVDVAGDGPGGLEKIMKNSFDLVLLDVMLPGMSGFDVCRKVRGEGIETPIILLTARGEEIDKVLGLELGADDYVTKPFSVRELLARIKAILRRSSTHDDKTEISGSIMIGRLRLDFQNFQAYEGDDEVKLSHKEFEVLKYLYENRNELVSRYDLLENVWGYQESITTRTVDNFILRLRQKIEEDPGNPHIILTAHGSGYRLIHH
ncbi:response regulator transcription factor [Fulvivirga sedimenti]|uniref:Response regulator transcription factor n=1 Tax=Fulvivirga sedimenti TaxID=2879465 RepID=A0A9X1HKY7_9BACT|nr:response regulator transcription factor [Fulvivirga sedimenti]MCA6074083.1 response regulator transcription factor [Fulvivirga sedimenti]